MGAKAKLEVLDALRGFCALIVLLLHFTENIRPGHGSFLVPRGYLPVEYFFILTGFTFVYAYDGRWSGMSVWSFFKRRLLRMHPLVVVGTLLGALLYLLVPEQSCLRGGHGWGWYTLATFWGCTLIPMPKAMGWTLLHVMQGPLWTMFYIYVANVLYALVLRHFKTWLLGLAAIASIGYSVYIGCRFADFGRGWRFEMDHVVCAFGRLAFPVFAGMFIARRGWRIRTGRAGLGVCVALLALAFFTPHVKTLPLNGLIDTAYAVLLMPLVLLCGVGGTVPGTRFAAFCRFMGAYSFPLYATHFPLRVIQKVWLENHPAATSGELFAVSVALAAFAFINAWAAMKIAAAFEAWARRD